MREIELAPATVGRARFGSTLAADGDRLLVGATARDRSDGSAATCLYERGSGGWTMTAAFTRGTRGTYDDYGTALAFAGDRIAINSPGHEEGDGPVHVYERASVRWTGPTKIDNPSWGTMEQQYWAETLAFAGEDLLISEALFEDPSRPRAFGAVHVYRRGRVVQQLTGDVTGVDYGRSLAVDGATVAIGVMPAAPTSRGELHLYERDAAGHYAPLARVAPAAVSPLDGFSSDLALAGDLLVVGAQEGGHHPGGGRVEVFARRAAFAHVTTLRSPDPQKDGRFGSHIAFDGRRLAIAEPGFGRTGVTRRVWRYELDGSQVRALGAWVPATLRPDEWFGTALALGPGWLAAGAPAIPRTAWGRVFVCDW